MELQDTGDRNLIGTSSSQDNTAVTSVANVMTVVLVASDYIDGVIVSSPFSSRILSDDALS